MRRDCPVRKDTTSGRWFMPATKSGNGFSVRAAPEARFMRGYIVRRERQMKSRAPSRNQLHLLGGLVIAEQIKSKSSPRNLRKHLPGRVSLVGTRVGRLAGRWAIRGQRYSVIPARQAQATGGRQHGKISGEVPATEALGGHSARPMAAGGLSLACRLCRPNKRQLGRTRSRCNDVPCAQAALWNLYLSPNLQ